MDDAAAPRGRGRPPHEPTPEQRARVVELVRLSCDLSTIAREVGISEPTLRQHYEAELEGEKPQLGFGFEGEDLGEAPPRAGNRGGRPPHVPSAASRGRVEILAAAGMYDWQIAAALSITVPTLKLHYDSELILGASRKKAEMIEAMFEAGKAGKVAAQKAFLDRCQEFGSAPLGGGKDTEEPKAEPKLGKKEQQLVDAQQPDRGSALGSLMAQRLGKERLN